MYYSEIQSIEEKRQLEKMNMLLNSLEQNLKENENLCKSIAKIIDMTVENNELTSRLEAIKTNIPEIQQRISTLILNCVESCNQARKNTMLAIYNQASGGSTTTKAPEYILKIQRTIDYCIANYQSYLKSKYNSKYGSSYPSSIKNNELLMLL